MKYKILVFVCLVCLLFVGFGNQPKPVAADGNTYYVATTGNDNNPGTMAQPWLTLQHAFDTAIAGDTVYFRAGDYYTTNLVTVNSGSSGGGYITYQNYPTETVTIHMYETNWVGLNATDTDYLKFIGLNFDGLDTGHLIYGDYSCRYGLYFWDCDHIIVQDCKISYTYWCSLYCSKCTNITYDGVTLDHPRQVASFGEECMSVCMTTNFIIKDCVVHDGGSQALGICLKEGSHDGVVYNCTLYNLTGLWTAGIYSACGLESGKPEGYYLNDGSQYNIDIYNNVVYNVPTGWGISIGDENPANGMPAADVYNINVYNNICYDCEYGGMCLAQMGNETYGYTDYTDIFIINNTFYSNGNSTYCSDFSLASWTSSQVTNLVIRNNISYQTQANAITLYDPNGLLGAGKLICDHNLWHNPDGWSVGDSVLGSNPVQADPLFVAVGSDFHIQSGSPAINTGSATLAPSTDYNGTVRPQGAGVDIGAYEYQTGSPVALEVTTNALPNGNVGAAYSQTLSATGGSTPYTWTITSGTLPAGLSLSSSGVISGTPATAGGPISVTFQVTDSTSATATKTLTITVSSYVSWDVNTDGDINILDIILINQHFGETGAAGWIRQDVNSDGVINILDTILVGQHLN